MSPDRRTSHLHRYEIKSFIAEVMELVRYNFFCLNNLKYECEFAGYLWENNNVFIDITIWRCWKSCWNFIIGIPDIGFRWYLSSRNHEYTIWNHLSVSANDSWNKHCT